MYRMVEISAWYEEFKPKVEYYEVIYRKLEKRSGKKISELSLDERDDHCEAFTIDIPIEQFDGKKIPTLLITMPSSMTLDGLRAVEVVGSYVSAD